MTGLLPIIENVPLAAYLLRVEPDDFVLEAASRAALAMNPGLSMFYGRSLTGLYSDVPEALEDARRCVREDRCVTRELTVRRFDRTEATMRVRLSFVHSPPAHMVLFMEPVQSESLADAALRESEARYRSLVASVPDGLLMCGNDGRVLACNDVVVQLFGAQSQADLLGKVLELPPGMRFTEEHHQPVELDELPCLRVLRTGQPEHGRPYVLAHEGRQRSLRVSAQPIYAAESRVSGSVTTFTDVTEQRELEEELRRAHRLESIGRLAGGIAHDFNNLLAAMMGALELLEDVCPPEGRADLVTARHAATRARDLTRQLLAFARKQPVEFKVIELASLVRGVERMLRRLVGPDVELVIDAQEDVQVRADASMLEQVLVNLVVNASEAMPQGGMLRIGVRATRLPDDAEPSGEIALIEVTDSGPGMDTEMQRRAFDPFFTTKESGTGLGLSSSYGIVKQHGGDVRIESRLGAGTSFRVLLPRVRGDSVRGASPAAPEKAAARGVVLVIDDEDLVRLTTVRTLDALGYVTLEASGAAEALRKSREHVGKLDILLCDVAMPGRSGPSIARELMEERPELKVLFISGYAPESDADLPEGALYLQKPFRRAELAAKLEELVRAR